MTTIAELEVELSMKTTEFNNKVGEVEKRVTTMGRRHNDVVMSMRRTWMDFTIAVGMMSGFIYSVEKMSGEFEWFEATLAAVSEQIGAQLIPSVRTLNKTLREFQESDAPARIGDAFVIVMESFRVAFNGITIIMTLMDAAAQRFIATIQAVAVAQKEGAEAAALYWVNENKRIDLYVNKIRNDALDIVEAFNRINRAREGLVGGYEPGEYYIAPVTPKSWGKGEEEKALARTFTPYDLMMQSRVAAGEGRAGIRSARPEEMGSASVTVNVTAYIDTVQDPLKIVSDVAQGALMGVTSDKVKQRS